jgi:hypothetical protein
MAASLPPSGRTPAGPRLDARSAGGDGADSSRERSDASAEAVIERGLTTFVEVGEALLAIRDGRLYRQAGYKTWEQYLERAAGTLTMIRAICQLSRRFATASTSSWSQSSGVRLSSWSS